jgi:hypothetical protein
MNDDTVGFVGDDGPGSLTHDFGAQVVTVVAFVGEERAHRWRERKNIRRSNDIGILTWGQMHDNRPAERIAQRMDFCGAASARTADGLIVLPLFRRRHNGELLIEVESSDNMTASLPGLASASKIAHHRPRLAQRLNRL